MSLIKKKKRASSRFHVPVDLENNFKERAIDVPDEIVEEKAEPFLLPEEVQMGEANNVLKFAPMKTNKTGISGTLFVTNFKVSFVTSLAVDKKEEQLHHRSLQSDFLGPHDICLSEIDVIYQIFDGGTKKKRLHNTSFIPPKVHGLQIICKNFQVTNFSFKFTPTNEDVKVTTVLCFYAFPNNVDHLYLSCGKPPPNCAIHNFRLANDWEKELQRTRCPNWRVSKHNESFNLCVSLPTSFVVPRDLLDADLDVAAPHFLGMRPPVWCWGVTSGAALVRMAQISPNISETNKENEMIREVHRCHPQKWPQLTIIDLDNQLPSLKDIQQSYIKLRELHTPDDPVQYKEFDRHYLSRWESSRWLTYISKVLEAAQSAASSIAILNSTVILQENEGRDTSAVVSSLVQILLDPQTRTIRGFHQLIQKEWVTLGHPFSLRLGHTRNDPEEQCPLWLLFLDCVHQLSVQHPAALQFTSEYLVTLWHAAHCSLHSSFMFNSVNSKCAALSVVQRDSKSEVHLWPLWSWWGLNEGFLQSCVLQDTSCTSRDVLKNNPTYSNEVNSTWQEQYIDEHKQMRQHTREAFINVNYVKKLLEPLLQKGSLGRLMDPVASAHDTWLQFHHLMGKSSDPLPYSISSSSSAPSLLLDPILNLNTNVCSLRVWSRCFGRWLSEPSSLPQGESSRPIILPDPDQTSLQWQHLHQIHSLLHSYLSSTSAVNGTSS